MISSFFISKFKRPMNTVHFRNWGKKRNNAGTYLKELEMCKRHQSIREGEGRG